MFSIYEFAALGTALSWAIGSMISQLSSRHLGTWAFNRYRMLIASFMLGLIILATGAWQNYDLSLMKYALLSGFVGLFLGDSILFACFARLGARRSSVIYAMNAPMTIFLGYIFLGEALSKGELIGTALTIMGVVLAIIFGKRKSQISEWEEVRGALWVGVSFGLLGALGQATGSIIIRPVMEAGADPIMTSFLRVLIAALAFVAFAFAFPKLTAPRNPLTTRVMSLVFAQSFIGLVLGMTLILYAFKGADAGIVATLSATTPVMILPILWFVSKERPALGAWAGAILVVIGTSFITYG